MRGKLPPCAYTSSVRFITSFNEARALCAGNSDHQKSPFNEARALCAGNSAT